VVSSSTSSSSLTPRKVPQFSLLVALSVEVVGLINRIKYSVNSRINRVLTYKERKER